MLMFCGDPHGRFDHIVEAAESCMKEGRAVDAIFLLGDIQAPEPLHTLLGDLCEVTWFIHGNHDTDSESDFENLWGSSVADRNIDGRVLVLPSGVRIAGLGGVFREDVWHPDPSRRMKGRPAYMNAAEHTRLTKPKDRHKGLQPRKHWSSIYKETVDRLARMSADILISHEAPSYHKQGYPAIDELARAMGASTVIHGHHHDCIDSSRHWAGQGFKSFGVGLRGISTIEDGGSLNVLRPGEMDTAWHRR